jgi:hypothetical protein
MRRDNPGKPIRIVPGGPALARLKREIDAGRVPGITDFFASQFSDDLHLSAPGRYLIALVHFACIYRESPEGKVGPLTSGLTPAQARIVQRITWDTVKNYPYAGLNASRFPTKGRLLGNGDKAGFGAPNGTWSAVVGVGQARTWRPGGKLGSRLPQLSPGADHVIRVVAAVSSSPPRFPHVRHIPGVGARFKKRSFRRCCAAACEQRDAVFQVPPRLLVPRYERRRTPPASRMRPPAAPDGGLSRDRRADPDLHFGGPG